MAAAGVAFAVAGGLVVSLGHLAMRQGSVAGSRALVACGEAFGIIFGVLFDVAAKRRAPVALVSSLGVLVAGWTVLLASARRRELPRPRDVGLIGVMWACVACVVAAAPPDDAGDRLNDDLATYAFAWLLLLAAFEAPWTVGGLAGVSAPFVKATFASDAPFDPFVAAVACSIQLVHVLWMRRLLSQREPVDVAPTYITAMALSGCVAGIVASRTPPRDPALFFAALSAACVASFAVSKHPTTTVVVERRRFDLTLKAPEVAYHDPEGAAAAVVDDV